MFDVSKKIQLVNNTYTIAHQIQSKITRLSQSIHIPYPCDDPSECSPYTVNLPPATYRFTLCGGNGGVTSEYQNEERKEPDYPYAAGCSKGILTLYSTTKFFFTIGGHGTYQKGDQRAPGGFNGGGRGNIRAIAGTGGGATDIRAEENDVFHRILVAGGGGGGDNINSDPLTNDGRGSPGGGLVTQGWVINNEISTFPAANQTFGFSFGVGEAPQLNGSLHPNGSKNQIALANDISSGAGGWFGGFSSHHINGGSTGGSSFALTKDAIIPQGNVCYRDDMYQNEDCRPYSFAQDKKYLFTDVVHERGVWFGNGFLDIDIFLMICPTFHSIIRLKVFSLLIFTTILIQ